MGASVQVTTKFPLGAMATRDWPCTPLKYWSTSNWLVRGSPLALYCRAKTSEGSVRAFEPGPAPDQVTTKSPTESMATSGLPQEAEAVVLTVNSEPI